MSRYAYQFERCPSLGTKLISLKVRCQATGDPHQFNVALCLALKERTGLNTVEVTFDIDLRQEQSLVAADVWAIVWLLRIGKRSFHVFHEFYGKGRVVC
jgi:hypothetical protein